jgi:hypothetical protein
MLLKRIELEVYINDNVKYSYDIKKKAKHITNYINRVCLSEIKFETDEVQIVVINLDNRFNAPFIVNKGLMISIPFYKKELDKLKTDNEYRNYIYCLIMDALNNVRNSYKLPYSEILKALEDLKDNDYKNEWIYKKKYSKTYAIEVVLMCNLLIDKFELRLIIIKENKEALNIIILETDPDEIAYEHRFSDIHIEKEKIIITSKHSTNLFEYDISI